MACVRCSHALSQGRFTIEPDSTMIAVGLFRSSTLVTNALLTDSVRIGDGSSDAAISARRMAYSSPSSPGAQPTTTTTASASAAAAAELPLITVRALPAAARCPQRADRSELDRR